MGGKKYTLTVYTTPYATVIINSISQTANGEGYTYYNLRKGTYTYLVSKSGYNNKSGSVTITTNQTLSVVLGLERPTNTVLLLHFDNNYINTVTGSTYNTSSLLNYTSFVTGKFGQGWQSSADSTALNESKIYYANNSFNARNPFSVSCWVKNVGAANSSTGIRLNCKTNTDGYCQIGFNFSYYGSVMLLVGNSGLSGWSETRSLSLSIPTDGSFHLFTATYNGSTLKIYIDGVLSNTINISLPYNGTTGYNTIFCSSGLTLDEILITTSVAWSGNFTPPEVPYE